jgi:poly-beta-1,6-N-acetyl-D-glucosamine synthase
VRSELSYAVVTPVRDERENLPRLAASLVHQTRPPVAWVIVDTGSRDGTLEVADELATAHQWVRLVELPQAELLRGAPIVRGFHSGVDEVGADPPDVVVKVDADVSFEPTYFAALLEAFVSREKLGIASGSAYELRDGRWQQLFGTRTSVWGAARAYRWACLADVLPLELRMGWDGVDELKANVRGWETTTFLDLPFRHHRREGERDGSRWRAWRAQGEVAYFMAYRPTYLLARAVFRASREPGALAMVDGYVRATIRRDQVLADQAARDYLRDSQRWRQLYRRASEALGRGSDPRSATVRTPSRRPGRRRSSPG